MENLKYYQFSLNSTGVSQKKKKSFRLAFSILQHCLARAYITSGYLSLAASSSLFLPGQENELQFLDVGVKVHSLPWSAWAVAS